LRALLPFVAPYGRQIALALLLLLLAAAATLSLPFAVKLLVDGGLALPPGSELGERLLAIREHFLGLFAVAVVLGVATAARYYMVSWIGERVTTDLRQAVYAHVLRQSPQFFETLKSGEVLSRLTTDTTVIHSAVGSSISMGLRNVVLFAGGLTMLVSTTPRLMLSVAGIIVLFVLPAVLISRRVRKLSRASQDRIADTSGIAGEILNAISIVQSYTQEDAEAARFSTANEKAFATSIRRTGTRSAFTAFVIIGVFGSLLYGLYGGVQAVLAGEMSAGQLSQTALYVMLVAGSVAVLAEVWGELLRASGATERLMELLSLRSPIAEPALPIALARTSRRSVRHFRAAALRLSLTAGAARAAGTRSDDCGWPDGGPGRSLGRRQDHGFPVAAALLRCQRGRHSHRRHRPAPPAPGRTAATHRGGAAGSGYFLGQHR
jgi:ATP-binding cassette subfamily B protein